MSLLIEKGGQILHIFSVLTILWGLGVDRPNHIRGKVKLLESSKKGSNPLKKDKTQLDRPLKLPKPNLNP